MHIYISYTVQVLPGFLTAGVSCVLSVALEIEDLPEGGAVIHFLCFDLLIDVFGVLFFAFLCLGLWRCFNLCLFRSTSVESDELPSLQDSTSLLSLSEYELLLELWTIFLLWRDDSCFLCLCLSDVPGLCFLCRVACDFRSVREETLRLFGLAG